MQHAHCENVEANPKPVQRERLAMQSAGLRTYSIRASLLIGAALINANDRWPWSARFAVIQRSHAGQPALLPTPLHASAHRRTGARASGSAAIESEPHRHGGATKTKNTPTEA